MEDWQQRLIEKLKSSPVIDLLEEVLDLAGGDDWDGHFTANGWRTYATLRDLLKERVENEIQRG